MLITAKFIIRSSKKSALFKNGKDINFKGNSDTEILVEYIQEFGIDAAINSIEGMFSIIVYNIDQKNYFL